MIDLKGKYNSARVFTDNLDSGARLQILELLDQPFVAGSKIRIMPDVHVGAGCTIGTTMTIKDKVVPNLVGVDIGCGMETIVLVEKKIDLARLDQAVNRLIPAGFAIRKRPHPFLDEADLQKLRCLDQINLDRARLSIGTLGGGNHFIEVDQDDEGTLYLVIHSGSRNPGKQVAEYYQKKAAVSPAGRGVARALAYCEGQLLDDYLNDMAIMQRYADNNRKAIRQILLDAMGLSVSDSWTTVHNYIDLKSMILRKGAVSAQAGQRILIPLNMRDGSLICLGKGNPDWNQSAPHGAGRLMSRRQARQAISLAEYEKSMQGIYTSSVNRATLDEAAFAYKPLAEITAHLAPAAQIIKRIKPIYNFKAAD